MPRINRYDRLPFENLGGGVDEGSPPRKAKFRVCENVRDGEGGTSKVKRPGLTKLDAVYDFGTKNVYGCFGIGEIDAVKQLALVEDDVQYKTGGAWGSIFTPTATLDVPVSVVKDKGLTIVAGYEKPITVLAGAAFYSGIVAPATLMEVHPEYPTACDEEDFAAIADWAETQAGNMHASQATFVGKSCLRFLQGGAPNPADSSYVEKAYPLAGVAPGKRFCVKTSIYFNTFQHASKEKFYYNLYYSATERFTFSSDGYLLTINNSIPGRIGSVGIELAEDTWYDLEFYVDTEDGSCDVWISTVGVPRTYYGNYAIDAVGAGTAGDATIYCSGHYVVSDVYLNYLNVYNTENSGEDGAAFGYGCTYRRGGNYPCESNPIESIIGSAFHYGTGLSDLTPGGLYVGTKSRTIQVEIDGTGTPDTVKISYDGGITWVTDKVPLTTTMQLLYGVTLTWGVTTGHTSADYWSFNCRVSSCRKHADERTEITGIPTSSESEVDQRRLWRTYADLAVYYWLVTLNDNTTTTYNDRHSDAAISGSDAVSYESYPPPAGEDCEIWDDRLWVTRVSSQPEALFYSRIGKIEQFPSPAESFFPLREDETDEVMKTIEFNNNLYTVKVNSIWILTKSGTSYRSDKIVRHTGTAAKGSVVATDRGIMMLTNHYKIGVCDGWKMILPKISDKVKKTLATINKDYAYRSTSGHDPDNKIYYLSIPTGANQYPDTTIAFYYEPEEEKFFIDKYHQSITSISLTDVDQYQRELLFGTKDGEVYKLDPSATKDDTTLITSKFRTGFIGNEYWKRLRRMFLEYYVPTGKTLDLKIYRNVKAAASLTKACAGATPSGGDTALRGFIHRQIKLGIPGRYLSFEFSNDEDVSGWEVMSFVLYGRSRGGRRTITPS